MNNKQFSDILNYLEAKNILLFDNKSQFERFLDLLLYVNNKEYDTLVPYTVILKVLQKNNQNTLSEKYSISDTDYKELLLSKLQGDYPDYPANIIQDLIIGLIEKGIKEELIFTKDELLSIAKDALDNLIKNDNTIKQKHIDLLYSCITGIVKTTIQLDTAACNKIKALIEQNPAGYFDNFVRLGMTGNNPQFNSVACEPFWEQIFGSAADFKQFIEDNQDKIPKYELVSNFWELYENNNYSHIIYNNKGNVQAKIDNNLRDEVAQLHSLAASL
jgi:hypothetical protein